jgi:hypothetical protein
MVAPAFSVPTLLSSPKSPVGNLGLEQSWIAAWRSRQIRICTKGAETRRGVGHADHGGRPGIMFAIERRRGLRIESAGGRRVRVVEPETHVESVGGVQAHIRVEAEDLIEQYGAQIRRLDNVSCMMVSSMLPGLRQFQLPAGANRICGRHRPVQHDLDRPINENYT